MEQRGLLIVHTGEGKGKTTAALGLAVRAWGDGLRVLILQFIKGGWKYGELHAMETLAQAEGRIEVRQLGLGFTHKGETPKSEHLRAAKKALAIAEKEITRGNWDMMILDEISPNAREICISSARAGMPLTYFCSRPTSSQR